MNRRTLLVTAGASLAGGCAYLPLEGFTNPCLDAALPAHLANHDALASAWDGIDAAALWDCHVHVLGIGAGGTGAWINPSYRSLRHPWLALQYRMFTGAACVGHEGDVDQQFVTRLLALHRALPSSSRLMLLAFDFAYREDGTRLEPESAFHIPDRYVARLAAAHPRRFEWIASVHPYRGDALEALERVAAAGARAIKWLPPAMGIDPGSALCDRFYEKMVELDLPLLTHGGDERAARGAGHQALGNPLRLRRALDHGIRVIVAHCASLGAGTDLDVGPRGPAVANFTLFERLMDDRRYDELIFGDLSAMTQSHRLGRPLEVALEREDWHPRLLYGSDYPLPGVIALYSIGKLVSAGFIQESHAALLAEIRPHNALLFSFFLTRWLARRARRFSPAVFDTRRMFTRAGRA